MTQSPPEPGAPGGPVRLPKYQRKTPDQRRRSLMDAAMRCLAERGPERTSIRSICEEAGVSVGLVNHYYAGKDALIADVYEQLADDLLATLEEQVDSAAEAGGDLGRRRLTAFIRASFSPVNLDAGLLKVWLAFWTMAQQSALIAEVHARTYANYRRTLERLIGQLAEEDAYRGLDVRLAAIGLSAVLDGLWLEWCLNPETFSPDEGVRLCEACLDGLLGPPRALGS